MWRYLQMMTLKLAALLAAAILAGITPALPIELPNGLDRPTLLREGRDHELQILENRERRRSYQELQQIFREQDRQIDGSRQPRPEIPRLRKSCQVQVFGSTFLRTCR
jgi:hypothetical protein